MNTDEERGQQMVQSALIPDRPDSPPDPPPPASGARPGSELERREPVDRRAEAALAVGAYFLGAWAEAAAGVRGDGWEDDAAREAASQWLEPLADEEQAELRAEIERLRQGIWDMLRIGGFDTDGDPTPRALVSDIVALGVSEAHQNRLAYDGALDEITVATAVADAPEA